MPRLAGGVSAVGEPRDDAGQGGERAWEPPAGGFVLRCAGRRGPPGSPRRRRRRNRGCGPAPELGPCPLLLGLIRRAPRGGARERGCGNGAPTAGGGAVACLRVPNCVSCVSRTACPALVARPKRGRDEAGTRGSGRAVKGQRGGGIVVSSHARALGQRGPGGAGQPPRSQPAAGGGSWRRQAAGDDGG